MWEFVANLRGPEGPIGDWSGPALTAADVLNGLYEPGKRPVLSSTTAKAIGSPISTFSDVEVSGVGASAIQEVKGTDLDPRNFQRGTGAGGTSWGEWRRTDQATKISLHQLSNAGQSTLNEVAPSRHVRIPIKFGARVDSSRIYFRNFNDRDSTNYGNVTFAGVFIGKRAKDANGVYTADFDGAPTDLGLPTRTTLTDGSYRWSVATSYYAFEPHTEYLLSFGYTTPDGQVTHVGYGGAYLGTVSGAADYVDVSGMTWSATAPLDVYMTLIVTEDTPVFGYLGSSTPAGVNTPYPLRDSFAYRHAYANGAIPTVLAHSGSAMTSWDSTSEWKWQKARAYDRLDRLYFNIGSNDVYGSATLAELQDRNNTVAEVVRSQVADQLFYVNIAPRVGEAADIRTKREAYNDWLGTLPNGALATYDVASVVTGPGGDLAPEYDSGDGTHLNTLGQAKTAEILIRGGGNSGRDTATALDDLPAASVSNRGRIVYVVTENEPYYSNGTIWKPVATGAQGEPGPAGPGVPTGGSAFQLIRKNSANTTTEWVTPDKAMVGLSNVNNTSDADKPVSDLTQAALDAKLSTSDAANIYATNTSVTTELQARVDPAVAAAIANDPTVSSSAATMAQNTAGLVPVWKANTAYTAGQLAIAPDGDIVSAKVNFTSGAAYAATNWNPSTQDTRIGGLEVYKPTTGTYDGYQRVVVSNTNQLVMGERDDGTVYIPNLEAGNTGSIASKGVYDGYQRVTVSATNQLLIGEREDGTVFIPNLEAGNFTAAAQTATAGGDLSMDSLHIGDSLTDDVVLGTNQWGNVLATLTGRAHALRGWYNQETFEISARMGANAYPGTVAGAQIPASGTPVNFVAGRTEKVAFGGYAGLMARTVPGWLGGRHGNLQNPTNDATTMVFTPDDGVTAPTGAAGTVWFEGDMRSLTNRITTIWTGTNDRGEETPDRLTAMVQAMIGKLRNHRRVLVFGLLNDPNGTYQADVTAINAAYKAAFPEYYFDTQAALLTAQAATDAGITYTAQDNTDIASGWTPTSFRSDTVHLNASGAKALAYAVHREYKARVWAL